MYIAYNEIFLAHNVQINLKWTITHGKNIDIKCAMDLIMPEKSGLNYHYISLIKH